jgi:hypothetical protein
MPDKRFYLRIFYLAFLWSCKFATLFSLRIGFLGLLVKKLVRFPFFKIVENCPQWGGFWENKPLEIKSN